MPTNLDIAARRDRRVRNAVRSKRARISARIVHGLVALVVVAWCLPLPTLANNTVLDQLHAAMLFNFIKMADWPASHAPEPVRVLVVGDDEFATVLSDMLATKTLGERRFVVSTERPSGHDDVSPIHVLVLGKRAENPLSIVEDMLGKPVLTVSLDAELVKYGCMLGTDRVRGKLRFDVNREAERRSGLKLSSRLLSYAREIFDDIQDKKVVEGGAD